MKLQSSIPPTTLAFLLTTLFFSHTLVLTAQTIVTPEEHPDLKSTFWGLCIQDAETGESLVDVRSHHLFTPASTLKLFSTGTIYALSQPQDRIPTYICTDGSVNDGVLNSDIYIIGHGDPSIGSRFLYGHDKLAFFKEVLQSLRTRGIRRIEGSVIAYSPTSDLQGQNPRWLFYDMGNYFGAGAYDLNVFDNSFELKFTRSGASYTVHPEMPDVEILNYYERSKRKYGDSLYLSPGIPLQEKTTMLLTGLYPFTRKNLTIRGAIPNPPLTIANYLRNYLRDNGISVSGKATFSHRIPATVSRDTLHTYLSPSLSELIKVTNTYSHNLFAESMLRLVGRDRTPITGHNALQTSFMEAREYWEGRGLDLKEEEFVDGCGLSPENKVTPAFMCSMLGKLYRDPRTRDFTGLLPLAGREGTLVYFLKDTPLEAKARLKSGSIINVIGYAGYVMVGGRTYIMAMYVNNYYGSGSKIRRAMEAMLVEAFSEALSLKEAA